MVWGLGLAGLRIKTISAGFYRKSSSTPGLERGSKASHMFWFRLSGFRI